MHLEAFSEFADEYQDWLDGQRHAARVPWFDTPVTELEGPTLLAVPPTTTVRDAIDLMNAHGSGAVLVVEPLRECLVGIFTERDVLRRVVPRCIDLERTPISEVMTHNPDVVDDSATLAQALRTMARARFRHLPVVDPSGRPLSIVSMRRIVQFVCEAFPEEILNAPPERHSEFPALEGA